MEQSGYTLIGSLAKPHGFKGDYLLVTEFSFPKKIQKWEFVFIDIDGLLIPFFISQFKLISENTALIAFEDIHSIEKAKEFVGCNIFQLNKLVSLTTSKSNSPSFENFKVYDSQYGYIGQIESILEYSQNILFRIINEKNEEILIPAIEAYIQKINIEDKELFITTPEGLIDLNN